jgi:hypothetical protein
MTSEVQAAIGDLVEGRALSPARLARAFDEIMDGKSSDARSACAARRRSSSSRWPASCAPAP